MQRRKDNKGRVLKDGEVYRKSDGLYMYRWTAKNGKRHTIYDATLEGLREKEEKIQHDLAEGIRIPECSLTLNDLFELWRKNKVGLRRFRTKIMWVRSCIIAPPFVDGWMVLQQFTSYYNRGCYPQRGLKRLRMYRRNKSARCS